MYVHQPLDTRKQTDDFFVMHARSPSGGAIQISVTLTVAVCVKVVEDIYKRELSGTKYVFLIFYASYYHINLHLLTLQAYFVQKK